MIRMKVDILESETTERINFVGVNFKENVSLSQRYSDYLKQVLRVDILSISTIPVEPPVAI